MDRVDRLRYCQPVANPATGARLSIPSDADALDSIRATWPPSQLQTRTGYKALSLGEMVPLDALVMPAGAGKGARRAVAVAMDDAGRYAAFPLIERDPGWQLSAAGDGTTSAILEGLRAIDGAQLHHSPGGFAFQLLAELPAAPSSERGPGTDQTNHSVVVGDAVIVKWHTAAGPDSSRSTILRRHLAANGFAGVAPLVCVLTWHGSGKDELVVADIDGYLPGAVDGWDLAIAALIERVEAGHSTVPLADGLGGVLGALTAGMHAAAAQPSALIPESRATTRRAENRTWRAEARLALDEAIAVDAPDRDVVKQYASALEASMDLLWAVERTTLIPIHGDLHLGQVVGWDGGMAVIDFDGPPASRMSNGAGLEPAARDVAQMLCSLDQLAVVVERRTGGRATPALQRWTRTANHDFLAAYRAALSAKDALGVLDERLLTPFIAEQYCRELIYAAQVLPRWRYAPLGAMTWRYPEPSI